MCLSIVSRKLPNNLPHILWKPDSKTPGQEWMALFPRRAFDIEFLSNDSPNSARTKIVMSNLLNKIDKKITITYFKIDPILLRSINYI